MHGLRRVILRLLKKMAIMLKCTFSKEFNLCKFVFVTENGTFIKKILRQTRNIVSCDSILI